jgi:peroxiredoxin
LSKKQDQLKQLAEVVAISAEDQEQTQKMDELLGGAITLLRDPSLEVISTYRMEHSMGGSTIANMGYAIIDRNGRLTEFAVDPLFGRHANNIIATLKDLQ